MQHKVKVTVLDKKLYPELQQKYCKNPNAGACPCYNVGDTYIFERYGNRDDFWRIGLDTLEECHGNPLETAGGKKMPHCSEAWDAMSRYIYAAIEGGSVMKSWMKEENTMITCCNDGTRPVIFKIERLDYKALYIDLDGKNSINTLESQIKERLSPLPSISNIEFKSQWIEVYVNENISDTEIIAALKPIKVLKID